MLQGGGGWMGWGWEWWCWTALGDLAPALYPCTCSLVMHWFALGPPISSETGPSQTKSELYGCAHYVNNMSPSVYTQPPSVFQLFLTDVWVGQSYMRYKIVLLNQWVLLWACMHYLGGWNDSLTFSACTCYWLKCHAWPWTVINCNIFVCLFSSLLFLCSWRWADGTNGLQ